MARNKELDIKVTKEILKYISDIEIAISIPTIEFKDKHVIELPETLSLLPKEEFNLDKSKIYLIDSDTSYTKHKYVSIGKHLTNQDIDNMVGYADLTNEEYIRELFELNLPLLRYVDNITEALHRNIFVNKKLYTFAGKDTVERLSKGATLFYRGDYGTCIINQLGYPYPYETSIRILEFIRVFFGKSHTIILDISQVDLEYINPSPSLNLKGGNKIIIKESFTYEDLKSEGILEDTEDPEVIEYLRGNATYLNNTQTLEYLRAGKFICYVSSNKAGLINENQKGKIHLKSALKLVELIKEEIKEEIKWIII